MTPQTPKIIISLIAKGMLAVDNTYISKTIIWDNIYFRLLLFRLIDRNLSETIPIKEQSKQ